MEAIPINSFCVCGHFNWKYISKCMLNIGKQQNPLLQPHTCITIPIQKVKEILILHNKLSSSCKFKLINTCEAFLHHTGRQDCSKGRSNYFSYWEKWLSNSMRGLCCWSTPMTSFTYLQEPMLLGGFTALGTQTGQRNNTNILDKDI